ncbi:Uncharacterised protein [Candidatus Gugararchaeum adminiculabundum]|nr:Uncharacterised protein [Candidatus Gugararchaeum adminiculabundum]
MADEINEIGKTFVCDCGERLNVKVTSELALENIELNGSCPKCKAKFRISMSSLISKISASPQSSSSASTDNLADAISAVTYESAASISQSNESSQQSDSGSDSVNYNDLPMELFGEG